MLNQDFKEGDFVEIQNDCSVVKKGEIIRLTLGRSVNGTREFLQAVDKKGNMCTCPWNWKKIAEFDYNATTSVSKVHKFKPGTKIVWSRPSCAEWKGKRGTVGPKGYYSGFGGMYLDVKWNTTTTYSTGPSNGGWNVDEFDVVDDEKWSVPIQPLGSLMPINAVKLPTKTVNYSDMPIQKLTEFKEGDNFFNALNAIFNQNKKTTMIQKISNTYKKFVNKDIQSQVKAGFRGSDLELTGKGIAVLLEIVAEANNEKFTREADELIAEAEASKKE